MVPQAPLLLPNLKMPYPPASPKGDTLAAVTAWASASWTVYLMYKPPVASHHCRT